ncbi:MAG: zf-HC2 domain-containing protein [Candidatus Riflebacteria bacterium]|nr:zf-HC2 domain-containing protein [Candidatus Riflebacteria bacterium]
MDCEECRGLILTDFIDGELQKEKDVELHEHLSSCPECVKLSETARQTLVKPFREAPLLEPGDSLWNGITQRVEETARLRQQEAERIRQLEMQPQPSPKSLRRPHFIIICIFSLIITLAVIAGVYFWESHIVKTGNPAAHSGVASATSVASSTSVASDATIASFTPQPPK